MVEVIMSGLPQWSKPASRSLGYFYRDFQEIDIYVEDSDSEVFYNEILNRVLGGSVKIKKIFCLNGRGNVTDNCRAYQDSFPALFIIDGDLQLFFGEKETEHKNLFQHDLYCVENYLICKEAVAQLILESSGVKNLIDILKDMNWDEYIEKNFNPLIELFKVYAVSWRIAPELPTVSKSFYDFCKLESKRRGQVTCGDKVNEVISIIKNELVERSSLAQYELHYSQVSAVLEGRQEPYDLVSGKDYLLLSLRDYLKFHGVQSTGNLHSLKFRLARHCNLQKFEPLKDKVLKLVGSAKEQTKLAS
ncbi:DUF4435 domain-containing protein [Morganella morganii]|nr:DUF4435 domain-containing protein [Morganella morganii]